MTHSLHKAFSIWVLLSILALSSCGVDNESPTSPSIPPSFGHVGVEYRETSALVHFEVPSSTPFYRATDYFTLLRADIAFSRNTVVINMVDPNWAWPGPVWGLRTPPTSGKFALSLFGPWWVGESTGEFWFASTASRVAFNIRAWGDFEISCFGPAGELLVERRVNGQFNSDGVFVGTSPAPVEYIQLESPGIARCGWIGRGGIIDDLEYWLEVAPSLDCTPTVVRGATVTCSITNATDVDVQEWEFVGEMFVNDPTLKIMEAGPVKTWSGPAVEGGTVSVKVLVNGDSLTLTSVFSVSDRSEGWRWGPANWTFAQGGAPVCDSTRPTHTATLLIGWNRNAGVAAADCFEAHLHRWVLPDPVETPNTGYTVDPVPSGPNRGRWYVTHASFRIDRASNVNPHWLPSGPEYRLTGPQVAECLAAGMEPPVHVNLYSFNKICKGVDMDRFIAGVWGHEGFGYGGGSGHQGLGQQRAAEPGGDPLVALEGWTRATEDALRTDVHSLVDEVSQAIQSRSADESGNVTGNWPGGLLWVWNPTTRRYVQRPIQSF